MSELAFEIVEDKYEPVQSKNIILQVRFKPKDIDDYRRFSTEKHTSICQFIRKAARLLRVYYDYTEILLSNADIIIPLIKRIPRKF